MPGSGTLPSQREPDRKTARGGRETNPLVLLQGVVAAAVSAYLATRSAVVTLVAVLLAVVLVGWLELLRR